MTDTRVYPTDDLHYLTTGRILHSPNRPVAPVSSGRYSSLSIRSLPRNFDELDIGDGGADIPDIPLRRSAMAKSEATALTPLAQILAGNKDILGAHRPIDLNDTHWGPERP